MEKLTVYSNLIVMVRYKKRKLNEELHEFYWIKDIQTIFYTIFTGRVRTMQGRASGRRGVYFLGQAVGNEDGSHGSVIGRLKGAHLHREILPSLCSNKTGENKSNLYVLVRLQ